jgi:hypothetical protein
MPESLARVVARSTPVELPPQKRRYASASEFLWQGSLLEIGGIVLLLMGQQGLRVSPIALLVLLGGAGLALFGSILVSVGIIRWGILPLIERAERE